MIMRISVAFSVGFCGSLTTFSSWINKLVDYTINYKTTDDSLTAPLQALSSWGGVFWVLALGLSLPMVSMAVGSHVASGITFLAVRRLNNCRCTRSHGEMPQEPQNLNEATLSPSDCSDGAGVGLPLEVESRSTPDAAQEHLSVETYPGPSFNGQEESQQQRVCESSAASAGGSLCALKATRGDFNSLASECCLSALLAIISLAITGLLAIFDESQENRGLLW